MKFVLSVSCLLAVFASLATAADLDRQIEAVERWIRRFKAREQALDFEDEKKLRGMLWPTRDLVRDSRASRQRIALLWTDLFAAGYAATQSTDPGYAVAGLEVQQIARDQFEALVDRGLVSWLARDVLVRSTSQPAERRAALARLIQDRPERELELALITCARENDDSVRLAAFAALEGRASETVDQLFLQALTRAGEEPTGLFGSAEAHFRVVRLTDDSRAAEPLASYVASKLQSEDWHDVSVALSVGRALPNHFVIEALITELERWTERARSGEPVRRLQQDLVDELQRRSGRQIGIHPNRWRRWWEATSGGDDPRALDTPEQAQPFTEASFYGLRPVTDRVFFVIDRSGSMAGRGLFGSKHSTTDEETRYHEAVDQMIAFLTNLGETTRFSVTLFSDGPRTWRARLVPATPINLRAVRTWLLSGKNAPDGGTFLKQGIEEVLGHADEERAIEADTLIVLCDGVTEEGPLWVRGYLRRKLTQTRIKIHAVQLGHGGDGTLDELAATSGGKYVEHGF